MNLSKKRLLIIGWGICTFLLLIALIFLIRNAYEYRSELSVLKTQYRKLEQLNSREPFPSAENVARMKENLETLQQNLRELKGELNKNPFPVISLAAVDFPAQVQKSIRQFRRRAKAANVKFPGNMEIGFSQYASGGAIPSPENVKRLVCQLYSVEKVADILIRSGVSSIEGLEREVFEKSGAADEEPGVPEEIQRTRRGRRSRQLTKRTKNMTFRTASFIHPDKLYSYERIRAVFTAREDAVWEVMKLLAVSPQFIAVSEVKLETQTTILSYRPEAVKQAETTTLDDNESIQALAAKVLAGAKLTRLERQIAGGEQITVFLTADVYNFGIEEQNEEQL